MRFYYVWQSDSFREGDDRELGKFHMDYAPHETKEGAIKNSVMHFEDQEKYYAAISERMRKRKEQALSKLQSNEDR